ncbi:hemolysin family protein [uncultured Desulfobulbus sp.]|uniref:hemolysin family protein n=1 Tax=uncultured Desulfobulbus sp. TaxID=239745 RepID=UPI0029C66AE1|nr:hemolysin family protein [uncultured Desulfobulbus sp.]
MDLAVLVLLILLNGIFAMSEIAVISSRDTRLQKMANDGKRGANSALNLKKNPSVFLSTIQVGITMVGILSGAIGENALADPLTAWLETLPFVQTYAKPLALAVVVIALTYFSVVVGELVPKHLGLLEPEKVASLVARPMKMLARVAKPLVWFFSASSSLLLQLAGANKRETSSVTNEEIKLLMEQGAEAGVFHESEQVLVSNVLRLDEQPVVAIMTHRQDIHVLDLNRPEPEIREYLATCPFSRIIVCRGGLEEVAGLLRTADLLQTALACEPLAIEKHLRKPLYVPEYVTTTQLLEKFRKEYLQCALIIDEYGDIQGIVTLTDVLTAIVGAVPSSSLSEDQEFIRREDGSWLVDGGVAIERVKLMLEIKQDLSGEKSHTFHTLGGYIIHMLGCIPKEAAHFEEHGYRFEVVDMDRNRIDKILISRTIFP